MNTMRFKIGDRVRCIDKNVNSIIFGEVYRVIDTSYNEHDPSENLIHVINKLGHEKGYYIRRFELFRNKKNHLPEWL